MESSAQAESLIPSFKLEKILNQGENRSPVSHRMRIDISADQAGRRVTILGNIDSKPSILTIERAALPSDAEALQVFLAAFTEVSNLDANDIYAWYLAKLDSSTNPAADLKLNLIHPCTETHIKKYSPQTVRMVTETADIYAEHIRPYMQQKRDQGRLKWVFNIIEGRTEQDAIILRSSHDLGKDEAGFLLLPDMNWDRTTMNSLRILGLVERRDLWSLRDLRKKDVPWLKAMMAAMTDAIVNVYAGEVEKDGLKVYVHCECEPQAEPNLPFCSPSERPAYVLPFSHPHRLGRR